MSRSKPGREACGQLILTSFCPNWQQIFEFFSATPNPKHLLLHTNERGAWRSLLGLVFYVFDHEPAQERTKEDAKILLQLEHLELINMDVDLPEGFIRFMRHRKNQIKRVKFRSVWSQDSRYGTYTAPQYAHSNGLRVPIANPQDAVDETEMVLRGLLGEGCVLDFQHKDEGHAYPSPFDEDF